MKENNINIQSPYSKILKERKKVIRSTIKSTDKIDMSNVERKECTKCHDYFAYPKLHGNTWYYICMYPLCEHKEKIIGVPVQTTPQQRSELVTEHGGTTDGPLICASFDRKGKKWSGSKKLDDDDLSFLVGSGAVKVAEVTRTYSSQNGWEES